MRKGVCLLGCKAVRTLLLANQNAWKISRYVEEERSIWLLSKRLTRASVYSIKLLWSWFCSIFFSLSPLLGCSHTSRESPTKVVLVLQESRVAPALSTPAQSSHSLTSRIHTPKLNHEQTYCKQNPPDQETRNSYEPVPSSSSLQPLSSRAFHLISYFSNKSLKGLG